jgi:hypothetical protein
MWAKKMVIFLSQTESTPKHFLEKKALSIAIPFRDLSARGGEWSASHPVRFTPGKNPVPIV